MYFFLPAWYRGDGSWNGRDRIWFSQGSRHGFDDTINQVRMFTQAQEAVTLLVPVFFPDLRYFCYQQNIYEVPRLSVFDFLQGIPADLAMHPLDYHDLAWPTGATFVYGIFSILVYVEDQLYARLFHGPEGHLLILEIMVDGRVKRRLEFDDRGFVSRVSHFTATEQLAKQEYLDQHGNPQFIVQADGSVDIVTGAHVQAEQVHYANLTLLLEEEFRRFETNYLGPRDVVIAAADPFHDAFLHRAIPAANLAFSYFGDRVDLANTLEAIAAQRALLTIADSTATQHELQAIGVQALQLPPLDTRLSLGISNQVRLLKLFFLVDGLALAELRQAVRTIMQKMEKNPLIDLTFASYHNQEQVPELERLVHELAVEREFKDAYTFNQVEAQAAENQLADDLAHARTHQRQHDIHFVAIDSEPGLIQAIHDSRILLDLALRPDVFLQIAGISAGIPEILRAESRYVEDGKNGRRVQNLTTDLATALDYYLTSLKHWNTALVHAANKIADYTSGRVVKQLATSLAVARERR